MPMNKTPGLARRRALLTSRAAVVETANQGGGGVAAAASSCHRAAVAWSPAVATLTPPIVTNRGEVRVCV